MKGRREKKGGRGDERHKCRTDNNNNNNNNNNKRRAGEQHAMYFVWIL